MTIRIIVREINYAEMSPHGGGFLNSLKTFDIDAAALEECLRKSGYGFRQHVEIVGAELLPQEPKP